MEHLYFSVLPCGSKTESNRDRRITSTRPDQKKGRRKTTVGPRSGSVTPRTEHALSLLGLARPGHTQRHYTARKTLLMEVCRSLFTLTLETSCPQMMSARTKNNPSASENRMRLTNGTTTSCYLTCSEILGQYFLCT